CTSLLTRPRRAICVTSDFSISEILVYSSSRYPRNFLARYCSRHALHTPRLAAHSGRSRLIISTSTGSRLFGFTSVRASTIVLQSEQATLGMGARLPVRAGGWPRGDSARGTPSDRPPPR